jgi:LAGLIDADG DNA endonuclease family protein
MQAIGQSAGKSFAYLLGVFLGDGCVTKYQKKYLVFRLNTIDEDFALAVKAALREISKHPVSLCCHPVAKSSKPNWSLGCMDRKFCEGVLADTDKKQRIPDYVFEWPRDLKLAFIGGLMDSEGYVGANSNSTGRRYYIGYKSCDAWVPEFIRLLHSVGIRTGKIGIERPYKAGYKTPMRFTIKMQSWIDSGATFNIARKQRRVDEWGATVPNPLGLRFRAKLTSETTCETPTRKAMI